MVVFALTQQAPPILVLSLLILCYLTILELRRETDLPFLWKAWWTLSCSWATSRICRVLDLAVHAPPRSRAA